jgi:hypothetical protein
MISWPSARRDRLLRHLGRIGKEGERDRAGKAQCPLAPPAVESDIVDHDRDHRPAARVGHRKRILEPERRWTGNRPEIK